MTEFQKYIKRYLDLIPSKNWLSELENIGNETIELYKNLSKELANFAYAEGKWTMKVLLQHLIDVEKIFNYRALRFSRNDQTELAGWDEELYGATNNVNDYSLEDLIKEFQLTRQLSLCFFKNMNAEILSRKGIANKNEISVETIGKLIVGHNIHHLNIIKERYLPFLND